MTDALTVRFEVRCRPDHAFATWTNRIETWWPPDHTVSGGPASIVLEGHVGGRIYERTPQGEEHEWGEVTGWRPPELLSYRWHLGVGAESATDVSVTFSAAGDGTRVQIEQTGWEWIDEGAGDHRRRNRVGWVALESQFRAAWRRAE